MVRRIKISPVIDKTTKMPSQYFHFQNNNFLFMKEIFIPFEKQNKFEAAVCGSDERLPTAWHPILSTAKEEFEPDGLRIIFKSPRNYINFRIEIYGGTPAFQMQPQFYAVERLNERATREYLSTKKIAFVGCARNCEVAIEKTVQEILKLSALFYQSRIIVFENDSTDKTLEILERFKGDGTLELISILHLDSHLPDRTERLSFGRNKLLNRVREINPDYFVVLDLDGVVGEQVSTEGFISNFSFYECWDAVFPVNKGSYYDIWAFRHPYICPDDFQRRLNSWPTTVVEDTTLDICMRSLQKLDFSKLRGWLRVSSAFNGMGIYKTNSFAHCSYFGRRENREVCEHVPFHESAESLGAAMYINPEFLIG